MIPLHRVLSVLFFTLAVSYCGAVHSTDQRNANVQFLQSTQINNAWVQLWDELRGKPSLGETSVLFATPFMYSSELPHDTRYNCYYFLKADFSELRSMDSVGKFLMHPATDKLTTFPMSNVGVSENSRALMQERLDKLNRIVGMMSLAGQFGILFYTDAVWRATGRVSNQFSVGMSQALSNARGLSRGIQLMKSPLIFKDALGVIDKRLWIYLGATLTARVVTGSAEYYFGTQDKSLGFVANQYMLEDSPEQQQMFSGDLVHIPQGREIVDFLAEAIRETGSPWEYPTPPGVNAPTCYSPVGLAKKLGLYSRSL